MNITKTAVDGALLLEFQAYEDERGFFTRTFCAREFAKAGLPVNMVQANHAGSVARGTLRGLHYQMAPYEEAKLLRCIKGAVYDVVVDIRPASKTYGLWFGAELTASNRRMMFVPCGCAHGYLTLANDSEVYYLVSEFYESSAEKGVRWNDPAFNITWPITEDLIISEKDKVWPDFKL
ncbi:dTDP-4-dehydrorhamnose 3,5-epimerase [Desulfocastanea catecholica]